MQPLVRVSNLTKSFVGRRVVDDVSFTIAKGEVLGFLGPNGAGKSTTMKMITGFLTPDAGEIEIAGLDMKISPVAAKREMGYLPEGAPLYGDMDVIAYLGFVAQIHGLRGKQKRSRLKEVVERVNLGDVQHQIVETLSKGFKRRVGIAQAMLHDPHILVLDEPTDGLDPNQKHEVRKLICEMSADKAIILATHILEEVDAVCTRATIIAEGKILADGTPEELKQRSALHQSLVLRVPLSSHTQAIAAATMVSGVTRVETEAENEEYATLRILTHDGLKLIEPIAKALDVKMVPATELFMEPGRLDDVFREITLGSNLATEKSEGGDKA